VYFVSGAMTSIDILTRLKLRIEVGIDLPTHPTTSAVSE